MGVGDPMPPAGRALDQRLELPAAAKKSSARASAMTMEAVEQSRFRPRGVLLTPAHAAEDDRRADEEEDQSGQDEAAGDGAGREAGRRSHGARHPSRRKSRSEEGRE